MPMVRGGFSVMSGLPIVALAASALALAGVIANGAAVLDSEPPNAWALQRTGPLLGDVLSKTMLAELEALAGVGDIRAQTLVGYAHYFGNGGAAERALGRAWLQMAANRGGARAQTILGTIYENGWGAPTDLAAALREYRQASAQGYALCFHPLRKFARSALWPSARFLQGRAMETGRLKHEPGHHMLAAYQPFWPKVDYSPLNADNSFRTPFPDRTLKMLVTR